MNIKDYLPETEILAQLAEECAELSQAALKLRRVLDKTNPTPVTESEAKSNLLEEISDVVCCLQVLGFNANMSIISNDGEIDLTMRKKERWLSRLKQEAIG